MKLTDAEKKTYLDQLWNITTRCYTGVEVPDYPFFDRCVRSGDVFVVLMKNQIVGYALVDTETHPLEVLLRSIAVLKGWRQHGIGSRLLAEIDEYYRNDGRYRINLHCKIDNPAQTLYFKHGYRVVKRIQNYYRPEGDGLEMRKDL